MIDKLIIAYLNECLSVPVYAEIPEKQPDEYIIVQKIDDGRTNHVYAATFNIESYSTSLLKAAELNEIVQENVFNAVALDAVSAVNLGGGGSNIDTQQKKYRYESIFNFIYYK